MRTQGNGDFAVEVEGIGRFMFARRHLRDVFSIRGEYAALTSGNFTEEGGFADLGALAYITLKQLMVSAPAGFELDELDPLVEEDPENDIIKVFLKLREQELSFRPKPKDAGEATGSSSGGQLGGVVSEQVQSPADGSAVS